MNPLKKDGETGWGLLISGFGDDSHGGGLFVYDGARLEQVDRISTTGLTVADGLLARLLRTPDELAASGELLLYDDRGVALYRRIDGLGDAHDIAWNGHQYLAVSSFSNTVFRLSRSGEIVGRWRAPGEPDSWHLNCLCIRDSVVFISAFGRFLGHREWNQPDLSDTGFLMNLETGADCIRGLFHPHSPRFFDGAWTICNSRSRELLQFDGDTGECRRRLALDGYTRGVAVGDDFLFVGESTRRSASPSAETASVAIVCRHTWTIRDRIPVPCHEIYDLALVPTTLLAGVRRAFHTNALRDAEQNQYALFDEVGVTPTRLWAIGDPLPAHECRVKVEAEIPDTVAVDQYLEIPCNITNMGSAILVSAPPNPVYVTYKWIDPDVPVFAEDHPAIRTRLPYALVPGESLLCNARIAVPARPRKMVLRITLVQEFVAWFDDLNQTNACEGIVTIRAVESGKPD